MKKHEEVGLRKLEKKNNWRNVGSEAKRRGLFKKG